jgi:serine/threonine protein kinase
MFNNLTADPRAIPNLDFDAETPDFPLDEGDATQPVLREADRSVTDWLDAFVAQECDRAVLLRGVADVLTANRDAGWELLSLVDQYYRRKKLSVEDFHALNAQLQALLFGNPPAAKVAPVTIPPQALAPELRAAATVPTDAEGSGVTDRARPAPPRTIVVGELLRNRYRIQGIVGRGGMGIVYAAIDQYRLNEADGGQRVAIKVLNTDTAQRPQLLEELRGEFQRLQALSHPNIVRVHDFDRDGELTFFTMEHLNGASLGRVLAVRNSAALHRLHALSIIRQVGAAVAYAHSRGVVHGDLNPRNIFLTDDGEIRVLDFGASHRLRPDPAISDPAISEPDDPFRIAVATPSYASCEMLVGRPADTRDDVYSLACISYVLLRGKHPFHGSNALVARTKHLAPKRPAGLSARQWRALKAGLQVDRKNRPENMSAWLDDLSLPRKPTSLPPLPTLTNAPPPREGTMAWVTIGLIALAAGVFWWAQVNSDLVERAATQVAAVVRSPQGGEARAKSEANLAPQADQRVAPPAARPLAAPAPPKAAASTASAVPLTAAPHGATAHTIPSAREPAAPTTQRVAPTLARIELATDSLEISPLQPVASVVVQRRHNYRNGVSFSWWTESGTAKPGQDFVPVKPRMDYIPAGESETHLLVPIVADPRRHLAKNFYVIVGDPSDDATLGSRNITMVTIPAVN